MEHPDDLNGIPYYLAYEQRYRRVYAQGVDFWTAHPDEIRQTTEALDAFLADRCPPDPLILECGCGEGHLAAHLLSRGFRRYVGVDIAPTAIAKARSRTDGGPPGARPVFHVADTTAMGCIADACADLLVDNCHWHMLVTDGDRHRYLAEALRVLRDGGRAYFRENHRPESDVGPIATYADYLAKTAIDLATEQVREAWQDGQVVRITLPLVPARPRSLEGYVEELTTAGFIVERATARDQACILHARKPTE